MTLEPPSGGAHRGRTSLRSARSLRGPLCAGGRWFALKAARAGGALVCRRGETRGPASSFRYASLLDPTFLCFVATQKKGRSRAARPSGLASPSRGGDRSLKLSLRGPLCVGEAFIEARKDVGPRFLLPLRSSSRPHIFSGFGSRCARHPKGLAFCQAFFTSYGIHHSRTRTEGLTPNWIHFLLL